VLDRFIKFRSGAHFGEEENPDVRVGVITTLRKHWLSAGQNHPEKKKLGGLRPKTRSCVDPLRVKNTGTMQSLINDVGKENVENVMAYMLTFNQPV